MRLKLAFALLAIMPVPAAHAFYTAFITGPSGAAIQSHSAPGVGENIIIAASGGLLVHSRGLIDPGFNSAFDFDTTLPGDQTLSALPTTNLFVGTGSGPDVAIIGGTFGSFSAPADQTFAEISVSNAGLVGKFIVVDNSLSSQNQTFQIASSGVTSTIIATGINVTRALAPFTDVSIVGGSGNDTFNIQSTFATGTEPLNISPNGGTNSVTIATLGNLDGFIQNIHIIGSGNNTALTINDSANAAGRTATITASSFTSPSFAGIFSWDANVLSSLTSNFGSGADNVTVNGTPANITNTVNGGDGNDTFNVTPGAANNALIVINGDAPTVAPGDTLNYMGAGGTVIGNEIRANGTTTVRFNSIETLNGATAVVSFAPPLNPTVSESTGVQQINLTLSAPMPSPVTVQVQRTGGTATPVVDFYVPAFDFGVGFPRTVTFPAGATTASFSITIVNDSLNEPPETIDLALASPSANATIGAPSTTTVTITSDDFAASDVPTLSEIALVLFGLLLVGVALRRL